MRPMFNNVRSAAGLMLLAGGLMVSTASAQTFSLELGTDVSNVAPGSTVPVNVLLAGGPTDTAAVNFTVSTSSALVSSISGSKGSSVNDFVYVDNSPVRTGGVEYRGVAYAPSGSTSTVNSTTAVTVATINVVISPSASADDTIELIFDRVGGAGTGFDSDGITGLLGVSNGAGVSQVPGSSPSASRPAGNGLTLTVAAPSDLIAEDFDNPEGNDGWRFDQGYPDADVFAGPNPTRLVGQATDSHYGITLTNKDTFGFFSRANTFTPAAADSLLIQTWTVGADSSAANKTPQVRLRTGSVDNTYTINYLYQDRDNVGHDGEAIVDSSDTTAAFQGNDQTYKTATIVDPVVLNGTTTGFRIAADIIDFDRTAVEGTQVQFKSYRANKIVPVSDLVEESSIYSHDFTTGGTDGDLWGSFILPVDSNGIATDVTSDGNGLTVNITGTPESGSPDLLGPYSNGVFEFFKYGFGIWQAILPDLDLQANRVYRVDVEVAASGANPPTFRLRANFPNAKLSEFIHEAQVENSNNEPDFRPDANGKVYTTYILPPQSMVGTDASKTATVAFDVFKTDPGTGGSVTIKNITITPMVLPAGALD